MKVQPVEAARMEDSLPMRHAGGQAGIAAERAFLASGYRRTCVGLCEDYPMESADLSEIRRDFAALSRAGISLLRTGISWCEVEPKPGEYRWDLLDQIIGIGTREYGIRLIPYVCYTPEWVGQGGPLDFWKRPPRDLEAFAHFMHRIADRYKDHIQSWEIWNEPDNPDYWLGSIEEYAQLLKAGASAVRQVHPRARVVLGGLSWNTSVLSRLFRDYGASPSVDVVNLHSYNETWCDEPGERVVDCVNRAADIIAQYGDNQALWMTEVGYSTFRRGSHVSEQYAAYYDYEHTPGYQATHLVRALACLLAAEKLESIAWYEMRELRPLARIIGDVNNRHLGLLSADAAEKPGWKALLFFSRLMSRPYRCIDDKVMATRAVRSDSEVHSFELEDGRIIIVAWLKTHVLGQRTVRPAGQVQDERQETIELALPTGWPADVTEYDAAGTARDRAALELNGGLVRLRIHLRGGQVAVIQLEKPRQDGTTPLASAPLSR